MIFSENKIDFLRLNELWEIYQGIRGIVGMRKGQREKKNKLLHQKKSKIWLGIDKKEIFGYRYNYSGHTVVRVRGNFSVHTKKVKFSNSIF